jgi:hypothetical protein
MATISIKDLFDAMRGVYNGTANKVQMTSGNTLAGKKKVVTTKGTRVSLDNIPCTEVTVVALKSNQGSIYVGGSDVTATQYGYEMLADQGFTFKVNNANLIYIDASVNGEGVSYIVV